MKSNLKFFDRRDDEPASVKVEQIREKMDRAKLRYWSGGDILEALRFLRAGQSANPQNLEYIALLEAELEKD